MIVPVEAFAHIAKAIYEASEELVKIGGCMQADRFDEKEVIASLLGIAVAHQTISDVIEAVIAENSEKLPTPS